MCDLSVKCNLDGIFVTEKKEHTHGIIYVCIYAEKDSLHIIDHLGDDFTIDNVCLWKYSVGTHLSGDVSIKTAFVASLIKWHLIKHYALAGKVLDGGGSCGLCLVHKLCHGCPMVDMYKKYRGTKPTCSNIMDFNYTKANLTSLATFSAQLIEVLDIIGSGFFGADLLQKITKQIEQKVISFSEAELTT